MRNRPALMLLVAMGVVAAAAVGWYLASPLFITNAVDEAFPFDVPADMSDRSDADRAALAAEMLAALPDEAAMNSLSEADQAELTDRVMAAAATVMPDEMVDDAMPAEPVASLTGTFVGADAFHQGEGSVTLYTLPSGERVLRFENFEVTNGPDLHVILTRHPQPASRADVGDDYVDLGSLKGNQGNQNYSLPNDLDIDGYQSVVIYCQPFHVVFATATLQ